MEKYICIHGHFYQPPRENPWLEEIELQESAYPYHDWNARITAESYAPNAYARILDSGGKIADIVNNFGWISFNIGPTLFLWLEHNNRGVYNRLVEADHMNRDRFSGHGSAIAQAYSHLIMPLANTRDKRTQVLWGIADFEYRFGRLPEGMWLPETAVDLETLDIMAEQGIRFTILSPSQAMRVRKSGEQKWTDVSGGKVNTQRPYRCDLPSGRNIALFFYDGAISHEIAFSGLLSDGQRFADRLIGAFPEDSDGACLVHVATDGETYGHYNHFADMALAYCVNAIYRHDDVHITVYGEYLERFPPTHEAMIFENTSWSCAHGVERWRSDCGDNSGGHPGWSQKWRAPLRDAVNWLRDELVPIYERKAAPLLRDPWSARDNYIRVILNRASDQVDAFFKEHAAHDLNEEETISALRLLEMQRHAMLMFTSCGWFFDEISGIETTQVMLYAKRAMQITQEHTGWDLEPQFMEILETAPSNIPEYGTGARVYEKLVKPVQVDLHRVAAHFSISSFFSEYPKSSRIYSYSASRRAYACYGIGVERLVIAQILIHSEITREESLMDIAVVYLGAHNFFGGIRNHTNMAEYSRMHRAVRAPFLQGDMPETITRVNLQFEHRNYSLWHLFRDEQRKVLALILRDTLEESEMIFRYIAAHNYPMMQAMHRMGIPFPKELAAPVEFIVNTDLQTELETDGVDLSRIEESVKKFSMYSVAPDIPALSFSMNREITAILWDISRNPEDTGPLKTVDALFNILDPLNLTPDLWEAQNCYIEVGKKVYLQQAEKAGTGDETARAWIAAFDELKDHLNIAETTYAPRELNI